MHFSIPDTEEKVDEKGVPYTVYRINVNGAHHCTVRYRQLHLLHEHLKKEFGSGQLPSFPPKRLLALSKTQVESRRMGLESYIQGVSQTTEVLNSSIFSNFMIQAQQGNLQEESCNINIDIYLVNGQKVTIECSNMAQTEQVMSAAANEIGLAEEYMAYFGLFLVKLVDDRQILVRPLQEFESPYISLRNASEKYSHRIIFRKSFWDASYEDALMEDRICLNLLFCQAVSDLKQGWIEGSADQIAQLKTLQQKNSKKEYLRLIKTLKFYGYIKFEPCVTNYPHDNCNVIIAAGNKEMIFRIEIAPNTFKGGVFKITRIRCWRITTAVLNKDTDEEDEKLQTELAFEYLIAKNTLQWITVTSNQAILMSMLLQSMVDELLLKREGERVKKVSSPTKSPLETSYSNSDIQNSISETAPLSKSRSYNEKLQTNTAFEDIGDDDL
ncbi:DgyrCDS2686 [Dimorphilus gyrociliatus]|uniref:Sorting nexin-17 n=1 Tax=Dimorphilus gyrociliatus TaxID=2664684 RepID=A0A7I8VB05_9ANNE|nr:DgyrCDS2686 [Dimorphilus gyrociliatus]